jgi:tetratricopeptide (TPR) repeat protein
VQLLLGEIYLQQNRVNEAIALYDNTSQMNPDDFRPILAKAIVLNQQGQTKAAEPIFQQALLLAPTQYKETIKQMSLNTIRSAPELSSSSTVKEAPPGQTKSKDSN